MILYGSIVCLLLSGCNKSEQNKIEDIEIKVSHEDNINKSKIIRDVTLLFNIHNNDTYLIAKNGLRYNNEELNRLFSQPRYSGVVNSSYSITVSNIKVDYSTINEGYTRYSTSVSVLKDGNASKYFIILEYVDGVIEKYREVRI